VKTDSLPKPEYGKQWLTLTDILKVHDQEVKDARSPGDVSDAAYKAVNAFRESLFGERKQ
jgi:hypothetical protein